MPAHRPLPPEILPGLDDLLQSPVRLHNVSITKGHSLSPTALEINATCTDPKTLEEIPVGIFWKRNSFDPDSKHLRAGDKTSKMVEGFTDWDHLEAESRARRAVAIREALEELLDAYWIATKCQAAYLDEFEQFVVDRFDEISQQTGSAKQKKMTQLRYPRFYVLSTQLDVFGKNIKSGIVSGTRFRRAGIDRRVNVTARCFTWDGRAQHEWDVEAIWEGPAQRGGKPWRRISAGGKTLSYGSAGGFRPVGQKSGTDDLVLQAAAQEISSIQDWAENTLTACMEDAAAHARYILNETAARRTRGLPRLAREEGYSSVGHPVAAAPEQAKGTLSESTDMDKQFDPAQHPLPTPGDPHLYDVKVTSSPTRRPHLDIEATFPDYVFPEGCPVRIFWDRYSTGEPELMVQAGMYSTQWRDGKFSRAELRLQDEEHPAAKVRLEAIAALYAIYEAISKEHDEALKAAHEKSITDLNTEIQKRTRHLPHMDPGQGAWLASQPGWFPRE